MTYLNAQQLAFVLDIKKSDARIMMCNAWTRSKGIEKKEETVIGPVTVAGVKRSKTKIEDEYPNAMPIETLAKELNLPHLQQACDDIEKNYLVRPASKRYILRDYPEKLILKTETEGKQFPVKISIPPALKSMLPTEDQKTILNYWKDFKCANNDPRFIIETA